MNISRRIRNIYQTQMRALKDRLDRIDAEEEALDAVSGRRYEADARAELADAMRGDSLPTQIRTPEEIARGVLRPEPDRHTAARPHADPPSDPLERGHAPRGHAEQQAASPAPATPSAPASALGKHYRVLGLEDGADLGAIKVAYTRQAARCAPERFPEGSDEQKTAAEIRRRVDAAYDALREALDPTAGRFDKLEL